VAPTIPIGYADYHADFPGTLSLKEETLTRVYSEVCSYFINYGVTHIVFSNAHGGIHGPLTTVMSSLRDQGILAATISWFEVAGFLNPKWALIGHGDFTETSVMLAINDNFVDLSKASVPTCKNLSAELLLNDIRDCRFRNAPIHVSLRTKDYTDTGDMIEYGFFPEADHSLPPTEATARMGREIIEAIAQYVADFIEEFKMVKLPLSTVGKRR